MILGLASWADAGFAASIQRAARTVIGSTTVDSDKNIMVVSGQHFGDQTNAQVIWRDLNQGNCFRRLTNIHKA